MLGFEDAVCAVTSNQFGIATSSVPFWMDNIQCRGSEETLDQCSFPGWGSHNCFHSTNDAGVVCKSREGNDYFYHFMYNNYSNLYQNLVFRTISDWSDQPRNLSLSHGM